MSKTDIAFIVQSGIIIILFLVIIFKKPAKQNEVDYDRIKKSYVDNIKAITVKIDSINKKNNLLVHKIDSLKKIIPNHKNILNNISEQIDSLNEKYQGINYNNSSDSTIISRLSR
jgi:peptidoglycan hydrolase CwlO-like protein